MAYLLIAYIVIACIVMACISMAFVVMPYLVMAHLVYIVMACMVMVRSRVHTGDGGGLCHVRGREVVGKDSRVRDGHEPPVCRHVCVDMRADMCVGIAFWVGCQASPEHLTANAVLGLLFLIQERRRDAKKQTLRIAELQEQLGLERRSTLRSIF